MSQEAFGRLIGVERQSVIRYEKGTRPISAVALVKLSKMGYDANWILTGSGGMLHSSTQETA